MTSSHRKTEIEAARAIARQARADLEAVGLPAGVSSPVGQRPTAHQIVEEETYRDQGEIDAFRAWRRENDLDAPRTSGPGARRRAAAELEAIERKIETKTRNLRHAGDSHTLARAKRNIETLEAQAERLREEAGFTDEGSATWAELETGRFCRNPDCKRALPRAREWPAAWCAACLTSP
jgi:hypothetical protein